MDTDEPQKQAHKPGGDPHIKVLHRNFTKEKGSWWRLFLFLIYIVVSRKMNLNLSLWFQPMVHELRITNQLIYVNPPVEESRVNIMQELFGWEAVITSLPRIRHSRYQVNRTPIASCVSVNEMSNFLFLSTVRMHICIWLYFWVFIKQCGL